jgi:hypothetical protein
MLENHNTVMESPLVHRYIWHIYTHFPFPAHVYLLTSLGYRTSDESADRAWAELSRSAECRMKRDGVHFFAKDKDSFIDFALGKLTLKAWEGMYFSELPGSYSI